MIRVLLLLVVGLLPPLKAHDPITTKLTWSKEVSRLFAKRCMTCHQAGGMAPFALTTYEEARPWAVAIRDEVLNRTMPPWNAVRGFGEFKDDMSLTQEEITIISDWVNGGAPEGEPQFLDPKLPNLYRPPVIKALRRTIVSSVLRLPGAANIVAARPAKIEEGGSAQLILEHPDGSAFPLLWILKHRARYPQTFQFREPIAVPPGSVVRVLSSRAASFELILK